MLFEKYFNSIYFATGEIGIFEEEEDIKIVTLPPTPYKNHKKEVPIDCGISTQILPLSRLSLSSSNTSTPPHSSSSSPQESSSSSDNKNKNSGTNMKTICEVTTPKTTKTARDYAALENTKAQDSNPESCIDSQKGIDSCNTTFSPPIVPNNTLSSISSISNIITTTSPSNLASECPQLSSTTPTGKKISPVRDKLDKLKKSLTDPLLHYFQISPECEEEPDLLNTPRSVAPPNLSTSNTIVFSNTEIQNYGFIATEIDELDEGKSSPLPKKLFVDDNIKDIDNHIANSSNDEGFSDNFKKEDSCEDNDENLPTPPPTPPPPIITDM